MKCFLSVANIMLRGAVGRGACSVSRAACRPGDKITSGDTPTNQPTISSSSVLIMVMNTCVRITTRPSKGHFTERILVESSRKEVISLLEQNEAEVFEK